MQLKCNLICLFICGSIDRRNEGIFLELKKAGFVVEAAPIDTETVFFEFQIAFSVHMDTQRKVF